MDDIHGLAYGGEGGVHDLVYTPTGLGDPDIHGYAYGGDGGVHRSVYVEGEASVFQAAWAIGSNAVI